MKWSDSFSRPVARARAWFRVISDIGITSFKFHLPSVMVPVLSNTKVSILAARSKAEKSRTRIPFLPAIDMPATRARGMAIPRAQGQEITITVTALSMAASVERPLNQHTRAVPAAIARMAGTNHCKTTSVLPSRGVLASRVFSMMFIIWPRVESSPVFSAL